MIEVTEKALEQLLAAVTGPPHYIRELQATQHLPGALHTNPINILVNELCNATNARRAGPAEACEDVPADLLAVVGFKKHDVPKVFALAKRRGLTVPQLIRASMRLYQANVEPLPDLGPGGCMGG